MTEIRPPIRWFGSKWRSADWIAARLPSHVCFVEVFGGSAAVLLRKSRSKVEVYNDINSDVVRFWEVLREHPQELARVVSLTPFSRQEHELSFETTDDPIERARRFVVRSWQTRGGYRRSGSSSWWYMKGPGRSNAPARTWERVPDRIVRVAERLRGIHFENLDWLEVLTKYDGTDTLFYLDPPYLSSTRRAKYEYDHELGDDASHIDLLNAVQAVRGGVALSGVPADLYRENLHGWRRHDRVSVAQSGNKFRECLWLSPASRGLQGELFI